MEKQIKITGLISSPRINGNTATLVYEALKGAEAEGAKTSRIILVNHKIDFCKGCLTCMARGGCVISDDVITLQKELASADGIILGSPNYGNTYNAIMRQFFERLGLFEFLTSVTFGAKYVAGISTSGGSYAQRVAKELVNFAQNGIFKRAYVSGFLGINLKGKSASQFPDAMTQAGNLGKRVTQDIRLGKKYLFQNIPGRLLTALIVKPSLKKFIKMGSKTIMQAVYENLRQRELM
ncbi:MAG: flavodoxin family protein [Spirochaetales bacterium]|nr:flavodoxin family protein [Spirochaetales bacterium]